MIAHVLEQVRVLMKPHAVADAMCPGIVQRLVDRPGPYASPAWTVTLRFASRTR